VEIIYEIAVFKYIPPAGPKASGTSLAAAADQQDLGFSKIERGLL
jgi:hypothetical protein